jgi:hypothetical protein
VTGDPYQPWPDGDPVYVPAARPEYHPGYYRPTLFPPLPPPAPRRRPVALWLVLGLVVTLGLTATVLYVTLGGRPGHTRKVALPDTLDGYRNLGPSGQRQLRGAFGATVPSEILAEASLGAYGKNSGDQPGLIAFVLPRSAAQDVGAPDTDGEIASDLLESAIPTNSVFSSTRPGVQRCGSTGAQGETLTACSWSDPATFGLLVIVLPPTSVMTTGRITEHLRAQLH